MVHAQSHLYSNNMIMQRKIYIKQYADYVYIFSRLCYGVFSDKYNHILWAELNDVDWNMAYESHGLYGPVFIDDVALWEQCI